MLFWAFQDFWAESLNSKFWQGLTRNPLLLIFLRPKYNHKMFKKGRFGLKTSKVGVLRPWKGRGNAFSPFLVKKAKFLIFEKHLAKFPKPMPTPSCYCIPKRYPGERPILMQNHISSCISLFTIANPINLIYLKMNISCFHF